MTKHQFLEILKNQLTGQISASELASHLAYYRNYIDEEIQRGRPESDIMKELGDPRLIARTLLDTQSESHPYMDHSQYSTFSETEYSSDSGSSSRQFQKHSYHLDLTTWYGKFIVIVCAAAVLFLLFIILGILIPIIVLSFLIICLISWFRRR